jgi:phosphate-selective porin OprO/OprP
VLKGKGPGNFEWALGYDASGDGKFLDAFAKYKLGGNGNHFIQAGQFKQPNSLEELSSTKNNDFISKAMATNTFAVARRLGVGYAYGDSNWGVAASVFGRELTRNRAHGSGYGARGFWAPLNDKGNILHLGLSYVDYDTDADTLRYRARPDADLSNRLIDTGNLLDTDRIGTLGVEGMWIHGPVKLQAEYMSSKVSRYGTGSEDFTGTSGYVSGVWNVTGETWGYKAGTPSTSLPDNPAAGMWQLGLRYDTMDLDDAGVLGGKMDTITAGVNWYWRSNFKFMLNYVKASSDRRGVSDDPGILEARAQFYW